jgi:hypothetical protein
MLIKRFAMPKNVLGLLVLLHLVVTVAFADEHPTFYIDKGACPFECCTYREWGVENETRLYAEPKLNSPLVGTAAKGTTVNALTGEVHTKPGKLVVMRDVLTFHKGDVLWVYTYLGEGFFKIWYQGKFIEDQIDFDIYNPTPDDWGYFEIAPDSVWWVKIRTQDGTEGWTNESKHFSNQDACG